MSDAEAGAETASIPFLHLVCDSCRSTKPYLLSCAHTLQRRDVSPVSPLYRIAQTRAERERAAFTERARQAFARLFPHGIESAPCTMPWATRRWTDWTTRRGRFDLVETDVIGHHGPLGNIPGGTRCWYAPFPPLGDAEFAFLRNAGMRWDDTDRKGSGPTWRRGRLAAAAGDPGDDLDGADDARLARVRSPQWKNRIEPQTASEFVFLRRWARAIRLKGWTGGPARPSPVLPTAKGWPRFSRNLLQLDRRVAFGGERVTLKERLAIDDILDAEEARRTRFLGEYSPVRPTTSADKRGWARRFGVRKADPLLGRQRARERAWGEVESYREHGYNLSVHRQMEAQALVDTANRVAGQVVSEPARRLLVPIFNDATRHPEEILPAFANHYGLTTAALRGWLARELQGFREPLRRWGEGRRRGWNVEPGDPSGIGVIAVWELFQNADHAEPKTGRPPKHDPTAVFGAIMLSGEIIETLHQYDPIALAAIRGSLREPMPPETIAGALHRAAATVILMYQRWFDEQPEAHGHGKAAVRPTLPTLADADAVVARAHLGRAGSLESVCRDLAAVAYGLPVEALDAMVKKAQSAR